MSRFRATTPDGAVAVVLNHVHVDVDVDALVDGTFGAGSGRATTRRRGAVVTLLLTAVGFLLPLAAQAASTTYSFVSGTATVRGTLAGSSASIFEGSTSLDVPLTGVQAVYDSAIGSFGRLESFVLTASDFTIDLNQTLVALDSISVSGATLSSLSGSDLNLFGQFSLPVSIDGSVSGAFPGGFPFGPVPIQSIGGSGSATGLVSVSGDQILISIVGVTVASFPQLASTVPNAPNVEIKADFFFLGEASTAVPEPTSALLFAVGLGVAHTVVRKRARQQA